MTGKSGCLLIQFTKRPIAGQVKTRLIPAIGAEAATQVHLALLSQTLQTLAASELGPVELWLDKMPTATDIYPEQFFELVAASQKANVTLRVQMGVDLGERMYQALATALMDYRYVILVGSDCPVLDVDYLQDALAILRSGEDVVFGPAEDGGFVLVGASRLHSKMFSHVSWGEADVLQCTLANCNRYDLQAACLDTRWDLDTPEDLARWQKMMRPAGA